MMRIPVGVHAFVWATLAAVALILSGASQAYRGQQIWRGWPESSELRQPSYAEHVRVDDVCRTQIGRAHV